MLCCLVTVVDCAHAADKWRLWVTSETEPWIPLQPFRDLTECEGGIRDWIDSSEGFWGKGNVLARRPREEGGYGLWSPIVDGRAWGIVEDNRDGAKRRVELLCLPDTAIPKPDPRKQTIEP
jgi:hypothetical protein